MTYQLSPWSLKDLFSSVDSPDLEAAFKKLDDQVAAFGKMRQQLKPDLPVSNFLEIIKASEEITRNAMMLFGFAILAFNADTQDQSAQTRLGRIQQFKAEIENRSMFFTQWWKALDDGNAQRLMAASGDSRYYLEKLRLFKPHTLSEAEEKVVNLKNVTGSNALVTIYDAITNHSAFRIEVNGEIKELTRDELMVYVRSADPHLRSEAYQELYRVYSADAAILGQMYQALVRDWYNENITLRKFASPIAARNLSNDIPDEVVETLLNVCKRNAPVFQRFFRLKARQLGLKKLRRYDIYAPVVESHKTYAFDQAAEMVLDSFSSFHPDFGRLAQRVFDQNHLDSEIRKGKQSGAFCAGILPEVTPWVLVNYQGRAEDVATLAHELGHAIHGMLTGQHGVFTFDPCLPLAETASTFGEMILVDKLLAGETDEAVRRDLLFSQVDDFYHTIMRQMYFGIFEKRAHEMVLRNASVDDLAAAYLENLQEQFGDAVEISQEFKWEWVSIPLIYNTPFYVYAYAFGQLLVLSLYQQYKAEGDSFKPRYIKMLSAGGSLAPVSICAEAGIDIRSENFWQGGFDEINRLVEQLERMK
jgi:oligoendopeptidase F